MAVTESVSILSNTIVTSVFLNAPHKYGQSAAYIPVFLTLVKNLSPSLAPKMTTHHIIQWNISLSFSPSLAPGSVSVNGTGGKVVRNLLLSIYPFERVIGRAERALLVVSSARISILLYNIRRTVVVLVRMR